MAVATFGNERWLPHQYVAAEDIVLKPLLGFLFADHSEGSLSRADSFPYDVSRTDIGLCLKVPHWC